MLAEILESPRRRDAAFDQGASGGGHEDLASMARRAETGRFVHLRTAVVVSRFTGMDRHPYADVDPLGPPLVPESKLPSQCGCDRVGGARKDSKEAVTLATFG